MSSFLRVRGASSDRWRIHATGYGAPLLVLATFWGCFGGQTGTEATPSGSGGQNVPTYDSSKNAGDAGAPETTGNGVATAAPSCSNSTDAAADLQAVTGLSAAAVVEFVQSANPLLLSWPDGTSGAGKMQLTVSSSGCASSPASSPASLAVPVQIDLTSDDARLHLVLTGTATARSATAGGIGEVDLTADVRCSRAIGGDTGAACAIAGVDETPYALINLEFSARLQSVGNAVQLLGSLRVAGSPSGGCSPAPCSINDWVSLSSVALSRQQ